MYSLYTLNVSRTKRHESLKDFHSASYKREICELDGDTSLRYASASRSMGTKFYNVRKSLAKSRVSDSCTFCSLISVLM